MSRPRRDFSTNLAKHQLSVRSRNSLCHAIGWCELEEVDEFTPAKARAYLRKAGGRRDVAVTLLMTKNCGAKTMSEIMSWITGESWRYWSHRDELRQTVKRVLYRKMANGKAMKHEPKPDPIEQVTELWESLTGDKLSFFELSELAQQRAAAREKDNGRRRR